MKRPLVASLVAAGAFAVGGIALAGTTQFRSHLNTANEIPTPINVVGTPEATLKLKLEPDGQSMRFDLKITDPIEDLTMAHLHVQDPNSPTGLTGPIVVWLYPSGPPAQLIEGQFKGPLAMGVITEANLVGPLAGNWEGFLDAIADGVIYANAHTVANPPGEIRDQVHFHPGDDD